MKKDLKKINKNSSINEAKIENNEIIYICKENSEEDKKLKIKELNDKKMKILESEKQMKEEKLKPFKEWIYGISKSTNNKLNINFKNQYAYYGYRESKIDLYKSLYNLIIRI